MQLSPPMKQIPPPAQHSPAVLRSWPLRYKWPGTAPHLPLTGLTWPPAAPAQEFQVTHGVPTVTTALYKLPDMTEI